MSEITRPLALTTRACGPFSYLMERGEWDAAATAFEKCIALNPQDARGYEALGYLYLQIEADSKALLMYREIVQRHPDVAEHRNGLGFVYLMMGKDRKAIEQFQTAVRLNPFEPSFHLNLAETYKRAGDRAKAEEEFRLYQHLLSQKR
jgi:tetratricopeptide (TPR) repeat protein